MQRQLGGQVLVGLREVLVAASRLADDVAGRVALNRALTGSRDGALAADALAARGGHGLGDLAVNRCVELRA